MPIVETMKLRASVRARASWKVTVEKGINGSPFDAVSCWPGVGVMRYMNGVSSQEK